MIRVEGALKKVQEEEDEGEDAWESWCCCRVNEALLSREPFSGFPELPVFTLPPNPIPPFTLHTNNVYVLMLIYPCFFPSLPNSHPPRPTRGLSILALLCFYFSPHYLQLHTSLSPSSLVLSLTCSLFCLTDVIVMPGRL